ncbi:L,D-transpeptidase [Aureimonas sp. ME7]|uniref:L,D-transpeptidase family protein n=1 Tax=Aureimonas sp. ME7 TaxID=2744252 RepID=UPI001FCEE6D3|nr:L,D-transpeptidase [Aureimonas sp. ME7]
MHSGLRTILPLLVITVAFPAGAQELTADAINRATPDEYRQRLDEARVKAEQEAAENPADASAPSDDDAPADDEETLAEAPAANEPKLDRPDPFLIRMQVLLDRANASPGVVDGFLGDNTVRAVRAYETMRDLPVDGEPDADLWAVLSVDGGEAMTTYEITEKDVDGRYVKSIPKDYAEMAEMKYLGFRGPREMLAERFHIDEKLLETLNPNADFAKAGQTILVPRIGEEPSSKVTRIEVDKSAGEVFAYAEDGSLVLAYPASIGSEDTPSPSGEATVEVVAPDPNYTYNPDKNFQQGKNKDVLTIPPGPNGPVGSMWIDLSRPTYGIHGTAEPSQIGKTESHGCVRLTNWNAATLSRLVEPKKTVVTFRD